MLEKIEPFICEIGGGNGRFAKAVLDELHNTYRDTYKKITYILIETSAYHRRLQQELLPIGKKVIQFQSLDEAKRIFRYLMAFFFK